MTFEYMRPLGLRNPENFRLHLVAIFVGVDEITH